MEMRGPEVVRQTMEGVEEVSPVSGCCGLKLKKFPSPGGALEAWQCRKVNGPRKPREVQRGPKRVTRRGVGPAEKSEKSAGDRVLVRINCNNWLPQRWNWHRGRQT